MADHAGPGPAARPVQLLPPRQLARPWIAAAALATVAWAVIATLARRMGNGSGTMGLDLLPYLGLWAAMVGDDGRDDAAVGRAGRGAVDPVAHRCVGRGRPGCADEPVPRRLPAGLGRVRGGRLCRPGRDRAAGDGLPGGGEGAGRGDRQR